MTRTHAGQLLLTNADEIRLHKLIEWAAKKVVSRRAFSAQQISDFVRDWDAKAEAR